jgi:hypothetical protein
MVTGSARLGPLGDYTANCRPVLASERAHHRYQTTNFRQQRSERKSSNLFSFCPVAFTVRESGWVEARWGGGRMEEGRSGI